MKDNKMYEYWKAQPASMRSILENRKELTAPFVRLYREARPDRVYLLASGTSLNSVQAAAPFMEEILNVEVRTMCSSTVTRTFGKPMMVFVSQGGSSTNTLSAMEQLKEWPSISMTGEAECEIKTRSDHHMLIGCGEELTGPKTKGYTSTIFSLYVCALEAGLTAGSIDSERYESVIGILTQCCEQMEENIRRADQWFEQNAQELMGAEKFVLVGKNGGTAAAAEGALKLLETVKAPAIGFEFEEYLHGPILMTDRKLAGLFFLSEDEDRERMNELALCHGRYSDYAYPVRREDGSDNGKRELRIKTTGAPFTEVFEFVLMPQLISAKLPGLLGLSEGSEVYEEYTRKCPTKFNNGR